MTSDRRDARSYHTRLGWWVMTHERGGPVLIGSAAVVILACDLVFAGLRWDREFGLWFAIGMAVVLAVPIVGRVFGNGILNVLGIVLIAAMVWIPHWMGGSDGGVTSGMVAGLSAYFVVLSFWWLRVRRA